MSGLIDVGVVPRKRLPMMTSSEVAECGLACLAMIGAYHGHRLSMVGLRQRFPFSAAGVNLTGLIKIGSELGLASRALKAELDQLHLVAMPAILHWNMNHFVVLKSVRSGRMTIHDPAQGVRVMTLTEVSRHFTGVVLEVTPSDGFSRIDLRQTVGLRSLWSSTRGLGLAAAQVVGLSAALQILAIAGPIQIQLAVDEAIARSDDALLRALAIGFGSVVILAMVIDFLRGWVTQALGALFSYQVVGNLFRHLLKLPISFFQRRHLGDVLSRMQSAITIQEVFTRGVVVGLIDGVMALLVGVILAVYSPTLALVVFVAVALNVSLVLLVATRAKRAMDEHLRATADERSHIMESIRAVETIRLLGREVEREHSWRNLYAASINRGLAVSRYKLSLASVQTGILSLAAVLVIYRGGLMVIDADGFSVGMLLAFIAFSAIFTDRIGSLLSQLIELRLVRIHLDRLGDIIVTDPVQSTTRGDQAPTFEKISLNNVSFRYGATDRLVLDGITLEIQGGEYLAITGPSGGGKSTLMKLLLGIEEPTSGEVHIDGQQPNASQWRAWREGIGVVSQDDVLFSGSLAENISFFDPDMDMGRVLVAAQQARIDDEIRRMPMGYQSLVGDMGSALSGGQRQRILLARALYREPKVLFLDEGTANLDQTTEELIADLIADLPCTRVVIAHRPALLERAHRLLVLDGGHIAEQPIAHDAQPALATTAGEVRNRV